MIAEKLTVSLRLAVLGLILGLVTRCPAAPDQSPLAKEQVEPAAPDAVDLQPPVDPADEYELLDSFVDTLDQIERNYVKQVDRKQLIQAAIRGMLSELDPYSNYIAPDQLGRFRAGVEGQFGGIGIQAAMEGGLLKVISPFAGTPAYRAGMMADDVILEIDGRSTAGITLEQAVQWMQGAEGTEVVLKVQHADRPEPEQVVLKREKIRVRTVFGQRRNPDDSWRWMYDDEHKIGYIRVTGFGRYTAEELRAALEMLVEQEMRGLVLDLRFNPGGLLSAAIEVSDLFLAQGRIVSTEGRNVQPRAWDAKPDGTFTGFPIAVLVNRYSASASEIVAAALQDHNRAVIVGTRTWGKGNVQNVIELADGSSALKLTTANYHRPNGQEIHRFPDSQETDQWGVTPDDKFQVRLTRQQRDRLLAEQRRLDIVQPQDERAAADTAESGTATEDPSEASADAQLQTALDYLIQCGTSDAPTDD
jgi:carboxyl-terminal processing protease